MKTSGATFRQHLIHEYGAEQVFPCRTFDPDLQRANMRVDYLTSLPAERRAGIRAYAGHLPWFAVEALGEDVVTLSILRDPVDRTISYLKQRKRHSRKHRDRTLEAIYDDRFLFPCLIHNHQTKVFALDASDRVRTVMDVVPLDDRRIAQARERIEAIDVLGFTDRHDEFLATARARFGWPARDVPSWRIARDDWEVPDALRRRIVADNAIDIELVAWARDRHEARGRRTVIT